MKWFETDSIDAASPHREIILKPSMRISKSSDLSHPYTLKVTILNYTNTQISVQPLSKEVIQEANCYTGSYLSWSNILI